jgi:hypothetical protein
MGFPNTVHVHGSLSDSSIVGQGKYPTISSSAVTVIDCGNLYSAENSGDLFYMVDFQQSDAVSTSYIRTLADSIDNFTGGSSSFIYKIKSSFSGKVYYGLRLGFTAEFSGCTINFYYSNSLNHSIYISESDMLFLGGLNKFYFVHDSFTAFDSEVRDFKISIDAPGVIIDSIIFSDSSIRSFLDIQSYISKEIGSIFSLESNIDQNISLSRTSLKSKIDYSSITLHMQIYLIDQSERVVGFLKCHSYINTNSTIFDDGWLAFNINYFKNYSAQDQYFIMQNFKLGISLVGCPKNENLYFIWSQATDYNSGFLTMSRNNEDELVQSEYDLAVKLFDQGESSSENNIQTQPPEVQNLIIKNFDNYRYSNPVNVDIEKIDDKSSQMVLKLPDRLVTFLFDVSGSMTWNDPDGKRFDIAKSIVDRFAGGYPGNLNYQVLTFGGTRILTEWFGVVERKISDTSDANEAKRKAFFDEAFKFNGVQIVRKKGSPPVSPTDGDIVFSGYSKILYDSGLEENTEYYYSIFSQTDDGRFSDPVVIRAIPEPRIIPSGIKNLNGKSFKASGVPRDENTHCLLHMDEFGGLNVFDFAKGAIFAYKNTEENSLPIWIEKSESIPSSSVEGEGKGSGLRLNGKSEYICVEDSSFQTLASESFGFMVWVYPFSSNQSYFDAQRGLINLTKLNDEIIRIFIQEDGSLFVNSSLGSFVSSEKITPNTWNHICIFSDSSSSKLYINTNEEIHGSIYSGESIKNLEIGRSTDDVYYFGKITEFSLHSSIRSTSYVSDHYNNVPSWNGESIAVMSFDVPSSYLDGITRYSIRYKPEIGPLRHLSDDISGPANYGTYQGDTGFRPPDVNQLYALRNVHFSRIVYGDDLGPTHVFDGTEFRSGLIDRKNYKHVFIGDFSSPFDEIEKVSLGLEAPGFRHFFRIFIINQNDISSLPEDSGLFEFTPPIWRQRSEYPVQISGVSDVEYFVGDSKVMLTWNLDNKQNVENILVYFSRREKPDIHAAIRRFNGEIPTSTDFYPVFLGDKNSTEFVLRKGIIEFAKINTNNQNSRFQGLGPVSRCPECDLLNGEKGYFSIYTRDKFGNYSEPVFIEAIPNPGNQESAIPPDQIFGIRYQPVDEQSVSIRWINPSKINSYSDIECWLDDKIVFYFRATDIFGRKLETRYEFKFITGIGLDISISSADTGSYAYPGIIFHGSGSNAWGLRQFSSEPAPFGFENTYPINSIVVGNSLFFDPERSEALREKLYFSKMANIQEVKNSLDGYYKIFFDLSNASSDQISMINQVYFSAQIVLRTSKDYCRDRVCSNEGRIVVDSEDKFEYATLPIRVLMDQPLAILAYHNGNVICPLDTTLDADDPDRPNLCDDEFYGDNNFGFYNESGTLVPGCYVSRNRPYTILIRASYRRQPLPDGTLLDAYVYDDVNPNHPSMNPNNVSPSSARFKFAAYCIQGELCAPGRETNEEGVKCWEESPLSPDYFAGTYSLSKIGLPVSSGTFTAHSSGRFSECVYRIPVPDYPSSARVIFKLIIDNFFACPQTYLNFISNLRIKINTRAPVADGVDVAKQICFAYTIDPDFNYTVESNNDVQQYIQPVPDFTPISWYLLKYRNAKERPFYSTSQQQNSGSFVLANGVFDFTQNGYSQNVFFGPVNGVFSRLIANGENVVLIGEEYVIKASITYNGTTVSALGPACIFPVNTTSNSDNPDLPSIKKSSFFMSNANGEFVETIYSDGKDYAVFLVSRDPEITYVNSSGVLRSTVSGFLKCYNSNLFDESGIENAIIYKPRVGSSLLFEIIKPYSYFESTEPYWKNQVKIIHKNLLFVEENGIVVPRGDVVSSNSSVVSIGNENENLIAITCNAFIPLIWSKFGEPTTLKDVGAICSHIHANPIGSVGEIGPPQVPFIDYDIEIKGTISTTVDGKNQNIISSGNWGTGNPPKFVKFIEPLRIDLAYVMVNGQPSSTLKIDGFSQNRLVFVVTFAGRPVSENSILKVYRCGTDILVPEQDIIRAEIKNDPFFTGRDISGNVIPGYIPGNQSFFYLDILPIQTNDLVDCKIFVESNYDESGTIARQRVLGVKINYVPVSGGGTSDFFDPDIEMSSSSSYAEELPDSSTGDGFSSFVGDDGFTTDGEFSSSSSSSSFSSSSSSSFNIPYLEYDFIGEGRPSGSSPFTKTCYTYDLSLEGQEDISPWIRIADMAMDRAWSSTEYINENIYNIGGVISAGITSYNEYWIASQNRWVYRSAMPVSKFGMQSCNDGRYIYCFGGIEIADVMVTVGVGGIGTGGIFSSSSSSSSSILTQRRPVVSITVHRYDTITDTWIQLKSMPVLDVDGNDISDTNIPNNLSITKYGVAFGKAHLVGDKIYIICGANYINYSTFEPSKMNDRILIYDIPTNNWSFSEAPDDLSKATYQRVYPSSFVKDNKIFVFGGSKYEIQLETIYVTGWSGSIQRPYISRITATDTYSIDLGVFSASNYSSMNFSISDASYLFDTIPCPRDQAGCLVINQNVYVLGGRIFPHGDYPGTPHSRKFERLIYSNGSYSHQKIEKIPQGRSIFGMVSDGLSRIFVCGGIISSFAPGYAQIIVKAYGEQTERNTDDTLDIYEEADAVVRLDGRSSCDLIVTLYDEEGDIIEKNVRVEIYGSIKFPIEDDFEGGPGMGFTGGGEEVRKKMIKRRGTRVYPIQISPQNSLSQDGKIFAKVLPRTEDPLRTLSEIEYILNRDINTVGVGDQSDIIKIVQDSVRFPYQIVISAQVIDDFYFGSTAYNPISSSSSSSSNFLPFYPEFFVPDIQADAGEFLSARSMPPFKVINISSDAPLFVPIYFFRNSSFMLMTQQSGFIGPVGDSDLYAVTVPKTGSYKLSVVRRGFSTIKTKVKIYNSNTLPYPVCSTNGSNTIAFRDELGIPEYFPECGLLPVEIGNVINLVAGKLYYLEVSALDENSTNLSEKVGEYSLMFGTVLNPNEVGLYANIYNSGSQSGLLLKSVSSSGDIAYYDGAIRGSSDSEQSFAALNFIDGSSGCVFTCPECLPDSSKFAGVSCTGSDNTNCVSLQVDSSPPSDSFDFYLLQSLQISSSVSSDPYDPYRYVVIPPPQRPITLPEYLSVEFSAIDIAILVNYTIFSFFNRSTSPIIQYYADFDWIPEVREILSIDEGNYSNFNLAINRLKNIPPFGCSPLFDGIDSMVKSFNLQKFDPYYQDFKETLYIMTDNDENTSDSNPDDVASNINSISGEYNTPIVAYNFNLFKPTTIANEASIANAGSLARFIKQVGGEIINFVQESMDDKYVDFGVGEAIGAVGHGEIELLISFDENVSITGFEYEFEKPNFTNILWNVKSSSDGETFDNDKTFYDIEEGKKEKFINSSFIKFTFKFLHFFKDSFIDPYEISPDAETPKVKSVKIYYNYPRENIIVLKSLNFIDDPQQVSINIITENDEKSKIYVGISSRGSPDWNNYFRDSQPYSSNNGKIFVPLRELASVGFEEPIIEPLIRIDSFTYVATHGSWNIDSIIRLLDGTSEIDSSNYKSFSYTGTIILNKSLEISDPKIEIVNRPDFNVAIKCVNYSSEKAALIKSISLFANTNQKNQAIDFNTKPIAYNLRFENTELNVYSSIRVDYSYADLDGDVEDRTRTIIKWYKNGVEIQELTNQKRYNDLNNPTDITYSFVYSPLGGKTYAEVAVDTGLTPEYLASTRGEYLFESGDIIYFTVQPHDGTQYGDIARSQPVTIVDLSDYPAYIKIRGRIFTDYLYLEDFFGNEGGSPGSGIILTSVFDARTVMFADFDFFSPEKMSQSTLRWYVNGSIWKEGPLTGPNSTGIYEILPGDIDISGIRANSPGNIIEVEIIVPTEGDSAPFKLKSDPIQIINSLPMAHNLQIDVLNGMPPGEYLYARFSIDDPEIDAGIQPDQSSVRWYYSNDDGATWNFYYKSNPAVQPIGPNDHQVGQKWKFQVTPFDGSQEGPTVESPIVTIRHS